MRWLQITQLHDDQEQEDADRQVFNQEILSEVPRAHGAQGRQNFLSAGFFVPQRVGGTAKSEK
jgi:hypothetical protein